MSSHRLLQQYKHLAPALENHLIYTTPSAANKQNSFLCSLLFCLSVSHVMLRKGLVRDADGKAAVTGCNTMTSEMQGVCLTCTHTMNHSRALCKEAKHVGAEEFWRQRGCGQLKDKQTNPKSRETETGF